MKIGFSLGRCIRDIVNQEVSIDDVAFLITATYIKDKQQLYNVIASYLLEPTYLWGLDETQCQQVGLDLWNSNRIIQPRAQGMHRHAQPENALWVDIFPTTPTQNENVKKAWEAYRFMIHMVENVDNEATEVFRT